MKKVLKFVVEVEVDERFALCSLNENEVRYALKSSLEDECGITDLEVAKID